MKISKTGKLCVSVAGQDVSTVLTAAQDAEPLADVIEIRLDSMDSPDIPAFIKVIKTPILFTNRAKWEGGNFNGDESARLERLHEAATSGAAYVDIELKTEPKLRQDLIKTAQGKCQTIISWHNFSVTPSKQALESILQEQYRSAADIGKIVTMASNFNDVLRVLNLQREAAEMGFPLIAFCMGQAGIISRVATLELGGFMTYASLNGKTNTAPGQIPVNALKIIFREIANAN